MGAYRLDADLGNGFDDAFAHLGPEEDSSGPRDAAAPAPSTRPPEPFRSRFGRVRWDDLDAPGPEHEYIIEDFLTKSEKSVIGGARSSSKSFLGIHAGMCIALGRTFFGREVEPGLVVYQAGEGSRGVKKRLRAWRKHFKIEADTYVPFELLTSKVNLYAGDGDTQALIEEIMGIAAEHEAPLQAVFIDTLATATSGADENSGKDMSTVMANVDRIHAATGAHVCLIHHLNAGGGKLRGHTSIEANVDQIITVARDLKTNVRTAVLAKQKDDEDGLAIRYELMKIPLGTTVKGKEISSCVCLEVGEKAAIAKAEQAKGLPLKKQEVPIFRALMEAKKTFGIVSGPEHHALGIPENVVVVKYQDWRDEYAKHAEPDKEGEKLDIETIRKRFKDYREGLIGWNVIGWRTPWMWWTGKVIRGFPETQEPGEPARRSRDADDGDDPY
jgi:hypothetical protein